MVLEFHDHLFKGTDAVGTNTIATPWVQTGFAALDTGAKVITKEGVINVKKALASVAAAEVVKIIRETFVREWRHFLAVDHNEGKRGDQKESSSDELLANHGLTGS